jgi:hypothetical protein
MGSNLLSVTLLLLAFKARGEPQPCPGDGSMKGFLDMETLKKELSIVDVEHISPQERDTYVLCASVIESEESNPTEPSQQANGILREKVLLSFAKNLDSVGEEAPPQVYADIEDIEKNDPGVVLWHEMNDNEDSSNHDRHARRLRSVGKHMQTVESENMASTNDMTRWNKEASEEEMVMSEYTKFLIPPLKVKDDSIAYERTNLRRRILI